MSVLDFMEKNLLRCHFKQITGFDCLGCGFQRSLLALLRGNFLESLQLFPALFPFLFTVIFTLLHLKMKWTNGAFIAKVGFILSIAIMAISYVVKHV